MRRTLHRRWDLLMHSTFLCLLRQHGSCDGCRCDCHFTLP